MPRLFFLSSPRLATPACTAMDLFSALLAIEPGLVLTEEEPGSGGRGSIEDEALASYAATRACARSGYGMAGWARTARSYRYLETEREFLAELRRMADARKLQPRDVAGLAALESAKRAYDELFSLPLARINDPAFSKKLEAVEELQFALAAEACARYPGLSGYSGYFRDIRALLRERRAKMAESLLAALGRSREDAAVIAGAAERGRLEAAAAKTAAAMGYVVESLWK